MEKLTLKEIAGYLPYGLQVSHGVTIKQITAVSTDSPFVFCNTYLGSRQKQMVNISEIRPVLYPLEKLRQEIEHNGETFYPLYALQRIDKSFTAHDFDVFGIEEIKFGVIEKLYEWHFDIHGLIQRGLAIDKSKLKP